MRLTQIKLAGFKSFVDSTVVSLPSSLIGIVGPNGCGKSNVIDAVRWVMGESSAKTLRGESMADVIFNGSASRKPVAQASVELLFDNKDGTLGGEYAGFSEIAIKRVVTRDGQSSYFLNGTRCRRRDITGIFLGTGLGPRSYSIIEQGTISRLIEAKPEELRSFLEEAAGISKYKERRRETGNRMRHTQENLDRLNDLQDEIAKQVEKLKRQARAAERYQELKGDERELKAGLQALRWKGLDDQMVAKDRVIAENENQVEAAVAVQRSIETQVESKLDSQHEAGEQFNEVQGRFYNVGSEIAQAEQSIVHTRSIREQQALDLDQISQAQTEVKTHLEADTARLEELEAALLQDEPKQQQLTTQARRSAETMAAAEAAMHEWQAAWDDFNRLGAEKSQLAEVEKTRLLHIDDHLVQLGDRLHEALAEQQSLSGQNYAARLTEESGQAAQLEQARDRLQTHLTQVQTDVVAKREAFQKTGHKLSAVRSELQASVGRKSSMEALQQAALGESDRRVTEWLETCGLSKAHKLAQTLQVESGWEHAVEMVLGHHLESVCVDDLNAVLGHLGGLDEGAVSFIDSHASALPGTDSVLLSQKVSSQLAVASLMAGVQFANSAEEAMQRRGSLPENGSVITREGLWLGPTWVRLSRGDVSQQGVIAREQELRDLTQQIAAHEARVVHLEGDIETLRIALDQLETDRTAAQQELDRSNRALGECCSRVSAIQTRLEQNQQRSERLVQEIQSLQEQIEKDQSDASGVRGVLEATLSAMADVESERDVRVQAREQLQASLLQARETANTEQRQAHDCALRIQSSKSSQESTEQAIVRARSQLQRLNTQAQELQSAIEESTAPLAELGEQRAAFLQQRLVIEKELAEARKRVEDVDHEIRALETERSDADVKMTDLRSDLEASRLSRQEFVVRSATLEEQIRESGFDPQTLFESLSEEANESEWSERVERNDRIIQRLGAINLAAIDEYAEQSERLKYLNAQHQDLQESLALLQNAISRIDKETRERFRETFEQVNAGFQERFPALFGGGKAYLELTGDDLLEAGVSVMAQPPGKRNTSIHLLSGGEKALTAVALVFSIFDLNPAPFCLLDEVDAPLDEANVGRFGALLEQMSENVQLIIITHNKATMEIVHQLSGVTMHEPGVSRLVTVDVDEATELVAV